jgi:Pyruvate/2-oxoacid:ferredoxin oxidoreductase gamma subunit
LGAFAAASGTLKLESILAALDDYFSGTMLEKNRKAAERGYAEVRVVKGNQCTGGSIRP